MPPVAGVCNPEDGFGIPLSQDKASKAEKFVTAQNEETIGMLDNPAECLTRDIIGFAEIYGLGLDTRKIDLRRAQYFIEYLGHIIHAAGDAVLLAMQNSFPYMEVDGGYQFVMARQRASDGNMSCYILTINKNEKGEYTVGSQLEPSTDDKLNALCEDFQNKTSN